MRRLRHFAMIFLFAGWLVPAILATATRRTVVAAPASASPIGQLTGSEREPTPGERIVTFYNTIAGIWFLIALIYAVVLTLRLRRTLI